MYISQVCNVTADYHFPGPRYTKAPRRPNWNVCYRLPLKQVHKQWSWNKLSWSGHTTSSCGMVILFRIIMSHVSYFFLHVSLQSSQRYHPSGNNLFIFFNVSSRNIYGNVRLKTAFCIVFGEMYILWNETLKRLFPSMSLKTELRCTVQIHRIELIRELIVRWGENPLWLPPRMALLKPLLNWSPRNAYRTGLVALLPYIRTWKYDCNMYMYLGIERLKIQCV